MILLAHDHDCEVNWVTVRSVHRLFRVSPIIFLHYGSECSYCLLSFQRHRLLGDLSYVHRCWIWLFFQAPPALLLEPWANQLAPLYRDSSQITEQSATFSQELFWSVRWLSGQGCLLQPDSLRSIPGALMVEGEKHASQAVFCPPHWCCTTCTRTYKCFSKRQGCVKKLILSS